MTQNTQWTNTLTLKKSQQQLDFGVDGEIYYPQYDNDNGIYNYDT